MTALCGLATSATLLFFARMGVGAAEGGGVAPSQALVAEYFSPPRRSLPFAILGSAPKMGTAIALAAGGWVAASYGWRAAFYAMGALAVPIAILGFLVLREPQGRPEVGDHAKSTFRSEMKALLAKRSFVYAVVGTTIAGLFSNGPIIFIPSFMARTMDMDLAQIGARYGLASTIGGLMAIFVGGVLANRMAGYGIRLLFLFPTITTLLNAGVAYMAFSASSPTVFLVLITVFIAIAWGSLPPIFAAIQHVCGSSRRALASAVMAASVNLVGLTLGTLLTGAISDAYSWAGEDSLKYAILTMTVVLPGGAIFLFLASRHVRADAQE
jgi:predicted MFS family arabinose efflux permease